MDASQFATLDHMMRNEGTDNELPGDVLLAYLTRARPAWMRDAACTEHPEVKFVTGRGEDVRPAKAICAGCLCRDDCLEYALTFNARGIWGGTSERERRAFTGTAAA